MKRDEILAKLRAHEPELRAAGIASLSLIGSAARGENRAESDVDIIVRLADDPGRGGFAYFGLLDALSRRLQMILGRPVDLLAEPVCKKQLRRQIEKDRMLAF